MNTSWVMGRLMGYMFNEQYAERSTYRAYKFLEVEKLQCSDCTQTQIHREVSVNAENISENPPNARGSLVSPDIIFSSFPLPRITLSFPTTTLSKIMSSLSTMQNPSCVLYSAGDCRYENRPIPTIEDPHDVIIRIAYTGVCGSDVLCPLLPFTSPPPPNTNA